MDAEEFRQKFMEAFEVDSGVPVVIVTGGETYNIDYVEYVDPSDLGDEGAPHIAITSLDE